MTKDNTVGQRVIGARKRLGFNQSELARMIGVTAQCVQQWERCSTTPRGKNLRALANTLQVTPEYIQFGMTENATAVAGTLEDYKNTYYKSRVFEKDYVRSVEQMIEAGVKMGWVDSSVKTKAKIKSLADFGLLALNSDSDDEELQSQESEED